VNPFDAVALLLLVLALIAGFRSGAVPQLLGLAGAAVGLAAGLLLLPSFSEPLEALDPLPRAAIVLVGLLTLIGLGEGLGSALGRRLGDGLGHGLFGALDDVAGAGLGLFQGLLVVWLVGGLLAISPLTRLASVAQDSTVVQALGVVAPPPEDVAGDVAHLLEGSGLPDLFVGLEPLPAPPVDRPSDPQARAIGALAEASTVKITSSACDALLTGSGVVVAPGYVVTNAHVLAGARTTRVAIGGQAVDANPVMFDPSLDVALLHAPRLVAPALRFAATDPDRGAVGAALGYPDGGTLTVVPAAVTRSLSADGRDIYDLALVRRDILELRAEVERGDSGGPLVLPDGTIGGVIFAEARRDPEVGYALTPTSVAVRVSPAIGRVAEVDTGPCIR
jgi:S1-C subfamily serine protease